MLRDPREMGPRPPFPEQEQSLPGTVHELKPKADYGEDSYKSAGRLEKRRAIITGADSGIGRAVAVAFAKEGADVVLSYLPEEEQDAREVISFIRAQGQRAVAYPGDIRQIGYCRALIDVAEQELGGLDVLVNNAGFQMTRDSIEDVPAEEFEHTFQTNVFGTFYLSQTALSRMLPGSAIVNTTSIQAFEPSEELLAYAATKAAIANLTKSLAKLAIKKGVRVNAVAPGPVWTPLIPATMGSEKIAEFGKNTAFGRPAQPVELARIFVFLASDEASFATGEIFASTGGRTPL